MIVPNNFFDDFPCCKDCLVNMMCLHIMTLGSGDTFLLDVTPLKPCNEFRKTVEKKYKVKLKRPTQSRTFTYTSRYKKNCPGGKFVEIL